MCPEHVLDHYKYVSKIIKMQNINISVNPNPLEITRAYLKN